MGVAVIAGWEPPQSEDSVSFILRTIVPLLGWTYWCGGWKAVKQAWGLWKLLEQKRKQYASTALHLQVLGTGDNFRGKGLGSQCIKAGLERADKRGVPCYLESSNPRNVPFYERHGF